MAYPPDYRDRAKALYAELGTYAAVARTLRAPETTVKDWIQGRRQGGARYEQTKGGQVCWECPQVFRPAEMALARLHAKQDGRPVRCRECREKVRMYEAVMGIFNRRARG